MSNQETVAKLQALRADIDAALATVMAKHEGLALKAERATYDANGGFTFKLVGTLAGGKSREQGDYEFLHKFRAQSLPPLPAFGAEVNLPKGRARIVGGRLKAQYNVTVEFVSGPEKGKRLCYRADDIATAAKQQKVA